MSANPRTSHSDCRDQREGVLGSQNLKDTSSRRLPRINPAEHRLMIHGLVERPLMFTMDDLMRFPSVSPSTVLVQKNSVLSSLAILLAVIAFELVGYLGLAMLGLLTLLVCANVELGKDGPLGGINNPELHAWDAAHRESLTRAERAEHRSETGALLRSLFFVRLIGGVFVVIGFGGFFFVQLR